MIYHSKAAQNLLEKSLRNPNLFRCKGYFKEGDLFIAFDNSTGHCNVEEFESEEMAICWVENYFEISEIDDFNIVKLSRNLYSISLVGNLKINFFEDSIVTEFFKV